MARGPVGAKKGKCGNRGMESHLQSIHKDVYTEVCVNRVAAVETAESAKVDKRDETVRGTRQLFCLQTHKERKDFLNLVESIV